MGGSVHQGDVRSWREAMEQLDKKPTARRPITDDQRKSGTVSQAIVDEAWEWVSSKSQIIIHFPGQFGAPPIRLRVQHSKNKKPRPNTDEGEDSRRLFCS